MVSSFFAGKFSQSFFSKAAPLAKKSIPFLIQTANLATQAIILTKVTNDLANKDKIPAEETSNQDMSTKASTKLNM